MASPTPEFNAPWGFLREIRRLLEAARRPSHGSQEYTPIPSGLALPPLLLSILNR